MPEDPAGSPPAATAPPATAPVGKTYDEAHVERLTQDAAKVRSERNAMEAELKKLQDSQLSETERASKRLQELEAKHATFESERQTLQLQMQVERMARQLGIVDEDAAYKLLDTSSIKWQDGKPIGVDEALKSLVESKPYLVASAQSGPVIPGVAATNPPRSQNTQTATFTEDQVRDPSFWADNKAAILQAQREGRIQRRAK